MIPNPPTDNLYKFVTFLGVAIFLFSLWTVSESSQKSATAYHSLVISNERLDKEFEEVSTTTAQILKDADEVRERLAAALSNPNASQTEKDEIQEQFEKINYRVIDNKEKISRLRAQKTEFQTKIDNAKLTNSDAMQTLSAYQYTYFLGLFMALAGIFSWYHLHQKYQDMILKHTAQSLQIPQEKADL